MTDFDRKFPLFDRKFPLFDRKFPLDSLKTVLEENQWFTDLVRRWHPAGDAVNSRLDDTAGVLARNKVIKNGDFQHLRAAFRDDYMNFYCGGQSIALVKFGHGGLQAKIHVKYVYGPKGTGQKCVTLTSKGFPEHGTGRLMACDSMQEWISNAKNKIGTEKRFVDLVVAHNPNVIDLEMGLPAYDPKERRAPRMDLVALEPHAGGWRVVLWEVKLVTDPRIRCNGDKPPEVVEQLEAYTKWLTYGDHESRVAKAYRENCRLLHGLHEIAEPVRKDIEELGSGILEVANSNATLSIDLKPRLLIIYDKKNESFRRNGHLAKLIQFGLCVKTVERLSELALCGQS